jgi:hypothetical protein
MTAKLTPESMLPSTDAIRHKGGFDETEYNLWLKVTCEGISTLLEESAQNLVAGESVEFTVPKEPEAAHALWMRYYVKVKDALIRKGYKVDESLERRYGTPIGAILTIKLED